MFADLSCCHEKKIPELKTDHKNKYFVTCYIPLLFACMQEPPPPPRKTRAELMKDIDADYYGYRDEDDGILVPLERELEKRVGQSLYVLVR